MKKKICYVITLARTVESFFIPQLQYLADNGYEVTVICSPDNAIKNKIGNKVRYIPVYIARGIKPGTVLRSIIELARAFKENRFDLVQYSTPNAAFCAAIAAKLSGIRIRNYHMMGLRYMGMSGILKQLFKMIERYVCATSTDIECITRSNLDQCIKDRLFNRDKAVIVGNGSTGGVDTQKFNIEKKGIWRDEIRKALGIKANEFVFGFVGRITRDKGVNELLAAYYKQKRQCRLLIAGRVDDLRTIDKELWSRAEKDDNIIILGNVDDIERYYAAMDTIVLPSYREGFGMAVTEAAAMGVPAIISDIPGLNETVRFGETALKCDAKDVDSLAKQMELISSNDSILRRMSEKCIAFVKDRFDSDVLNREILDRKNSLLHKYKS